MTKTERVLPIGKRWIAHTSGNAAIPMAIPVLVSADGKLGPTHESSEVGVLIADETGIRNQSEDGGTRERLLVCETHAVGEHEHGL